MRNRWKRAFLLALLLVGLAGVVLSYLELRPPLVQTDLLEVLSQASNGPILAPQGLLGSYEASPFMGKGWDPIRGAAFRSASVPAELLWSQTQLVPLRVELEGRCAVPTNVTLSLGSHSLGPVALGPDWKQLQLEIPVGDLIEGLNRLLIEPRGNVTLQWRDCHISPLYANTRAPGALSSSDRLCLYYGTAREFPLLLLPATALVIDDLLPWNQPGAPGMESGWELTVRIQSGKEHLDRTWHLTRKGRQKLRLPVDVPTQVSLSLMATASQAPLPGQSGVCLIKPRLDSWSKAPLLAAPPPLAPPPPLVGARPNIVLFLIDTLRFDHLHCYGYPKPTSPNIDALALDGVRFLDCVASSGWTKPSTASILTSLIAHHHRSEDFGNKLKLTGNRKTLAQVLRSAGYETKGMVANPLVSRAFDFNTGFQSYDLLPEVPAGELVNATVPWLKTRSSKRPFFLYMHAIDTHMPYFAPKRFLPAGYEQLGLSIDDAHAWREHPRDGGGISLEKAFALYRAWHKNNRDPDVLARLEEAFNCYDGGLSSCDEAFGQLISTLKSRGLYDNTVIVVVSDHGEEFFDHGALGHLKTLYQELLHVPLIVKFPNHLAAGTLVKSTWQNIDIAPTVIRQAQATVPASMEGQAYLPGTPDGEDSARPAYFSVRAGENIPVNQELFGELGALRRTIMDGVRVGGWVLNRAYCSHLHMTPQGVVDSSHASFIEPLELYDLKSDPQEHENLIYSRPEVRVWLASVLKLGARRRGPDPPMASAADTNQALKAIQYAR